MEYFTLNFDPEQMGVFPQITTTSSGYNYVVPNSIHNFYPEESKGLGLHLPEFLKIRTNAKLTDVLSASFAGFRFLIVSNKFKEIISNCNLPEHSWYTIKVLKKNISIQYNIFVSNIASPEYFDYKKSEFYFYNYETKEKTFIHLNSAHEFWEQHNKTKAPNVIWAKSLHLLSEGIDADIFRVPTGIQIANYIVSQKFVELVEKNRITGMTFKPFHFTI